MGLYIGRMVTSSGEEIDMRIIIGADIVPTTSNQTLFENAQMEQIVDSGVREVLERAD